MEIAISKEDAHLFALCISNDIKTYIDDHLEEYQQFLKSYNDIQE